LLSYSFWCAKIAITSFWRASYSSGKKSFTEKKRNKAYLLLEIGKSLAGIWKGLVGKAMPAGGEAMV
jgi:hypothetical protein